MFFDGRLIARYGVAVVDESGGLRRSFRTGKEPGHGIKNVKETKNNDHPEPADERETYWNQKRNSKRLSTAKLTFFKSVITPIGRQKVLV